jgi:hypothetical protein
MGQQRFYFFAGTLRSFSKAGCLRISFAEGRLTGSGSIMDWKMGRIEYLGSFFACYSCEK